MPSALRSLGQFVPKCLQRAHCSLTATANGCPHVPANGEKAQTHVSRSRSWAVEYHPRNPTSTACFFQRQRLPDHDRAHPYCDEPRRATTQEARPADEDRIREAASGSSWKGRDLAQTQEAQDPEDVYGRRWGHRRGGKCEGNAHLGDNGGNTGRITKNPVDGRPWKRTGADCPHGRSWHIWHGYYAFPLWQEAKATGRPEHAPAWRTGATWRDESCTGWGPNRSHNVGIPGFSKSISRVPPAWADSEQSAPCPGGLAFADAISVWAHVRTLPRIPDGGAATRAATEMKTPQRSMLGQWAVEWTALPRAYRRYRLDIRPSFWFQDATFNDLINEKPPHNHPSGRFSNFWTQSQSSKARRSTSWKHATTK